MNNKHKHIQRSPVSTQSRLIKTHNSDEAETIALENLGLLHCRGNPRLLPLHTIQAEAIRAALWMHSSGGTQPVHINKLLRAAQRLLRPIWLNRGEKDSDHQLADETKDVDTLADQREGTLLDDRLYRLHRDALYELETIGDIVELSGGYWFPAPLRTIALPYSKHWLFVGGLPTYRLSPSIQKNLTHPSFARILVEDPSTIGFQTIKQDFTSWYDPCEDQLLAWTKNILYNTALNDMLLETYHLYYPVPDVDYKNYWIQDCQKLSDGRYFACTHIGLGTRYWIVEVKQGKIVKSGEIVWSRKDPQRLCYGLDVLAKQPVRVRATKRQKKYTISLKRPLPRAEQRLFVALGSMIRSNQSYLSEWEIPNECFRYIHKALTDLKLTIN